MHSRKNCNGAKTKDMTKKYSFLKNIYNDANLISISKITLNFSDKNIEKKFRNEYFKNSLLALRISFITVIFLYSAFGYLDITIAKEFYKSFFVIRYIVVFPLLFSVFVFSFYKHFKKYWQVLLSICFFIITNPFCQEVFSLILKLFYSTRSLAAFVAIAIAFAGSSQSIISRLLLNFPAACF